MTELQLYKLCQGKEMHWVGKELLLFIPLHEIGSFTNLLGYDYMSGCRIKTTLCYEDIVLDLVEICEHFDIDPTNILPKEE